MPKVPGLELDRVQERPAFQQGITVRATADDFGAAAARGLGALGDGVAQAATAVRQIEDLEDTARAKEDDDRYAAWKRERDYGENGFFNLQGKAAVDGRAAYERELEEKRLEFGAQLSPAARQRYDRATQARVDAALDQSVQHTSSERKKWIAEASASRLDTFAEDALAGYQNSALVTKNVAAGQAEIRQQAELEGWDADTLQNRERTFVSGVYKNVALRMAQTDPEAAQRYADENKDFLSGGDLAALGTVFAPLVVEQEIQRETNSIVLGGYRSGVMTGRTISQSGDEATFRFLRARTPGKGDEAVGDLDAGFAGALSRLFQSAPPEIRDGLQLLSGYRSLERQQELWDQSDKTGHSVARPGHSQHNFGRAVDIMYNGQRLDKAPAEIRQWVHANAASFGLYFPMDHEPWHAEPIGTRGGKGPNASTVAPSPVGIGRVAPNEFAAGDLPPTAYGLLGALRGGESGHRYNIRFDGGAGSTFDSYGDHPRQSARNPKNGTRSTASGAYQFIASTWDRAAGALGLPDFSPASQDRAAWWLAQADYKQRTGRDLDADLQAGRYGEVRRGLSSTWEALKGMSDVQLAVAAQSGTASFSINDGGGSIGDPSAALDRITNPDVRRGVAQRLKIISDIQERERKATSDRLKTNAFALVDSGASPNSIPPEIRAELGREEMQGLWSYFEQRAKTGQPQTDDRTLYDLQTMFASDPATFADVDLFKYRDRLDDAAWKEVTGWRQSALNDLRKAREDGTEITAAFSQARTQLEAVGITTTGKESTERETAALREAQFQNQLAAQIAAFRAEEERRPDQAEVQQMINRLLLPVVVSEPGTLWGTSDAEVPLFEAGPIGERGDGSTARVSMPYARIPPADRIEIELMLADQLGRKPSEEEVEAQYAEYLAEIYSVDGG